MLIEPRLEGIEDSRRMPTTRELPVDNRLAPSLHAAPPARYIDFRFVRCPPLQAAGRCRSTPSPQEDYPQGQVLLLPGDWGKDSPRGGRVPFSEPLLSQFPVSSQPGIPLMFERSE